MLPDQGSHARLRRLARRQSGVIAVSASARHCIGRGDRAPASTRPRRSRSDVTSGPCLHVRRSGVLASRRLGVQASWHPGALVSKRPARPRWPGDRGGPRRRRQPFVPDGCMRLDGIAVIADRLSPWRPRHYCYTCAGAIAVRQVSQQPWLDVIVVNAGVVLSYEEVPYCLLVGVPVLHRHRYNLFYAYE